MTATTDRAALYRGILERPEDDVARLVYADWLEENGGTVSCPVCPPDEGEEPHPADIICDRCHGSRTVSDGQREHARFIRDCVWMHANHTDCPVRLADVKRGRPVPLRCGSCEYCTARRRAEKFYSGHPWLSGINYAVCFEPSPLDGPMPTWPRLTLTVSRGFVSRVSCRLADWIGGECPVCFGIGDLLVQLDHGSTHEKCLTCSATGLTPAHGPRIVAEQPVEEVRTDAVADPIGDEWCWVKDRPELLGIARIPPEVFNLLEGGRLESGGNEWQDHFGVEDFWRIYPTEAAAQSALSLALINWARRVAGLPPLREHATH